MAMALISRHGYDGIIPRAPQLAAALSAHTALWTELCWCIVMLLLMIKIKRSEAMFA